ncbi:MAG: 16S rRNA (guanine(966)-N(2))-methyltransferase RsmD [bacterium]|nr:16S rRNA (guanine(966)-N(2))-methyltransferase RsmD [bacterium]
MRIIAGELGSRRIKTLRGLDVRPTPDRLREALFNVLAARLQGCSFVDAYAGCGSVGIEALSRGASRVIFIERKRAAVQMIRQNLHSLGVTEGFEVRHAKAARLLAALAADIVFLDPPYRLTNEYDEALGALAGSPPWLAIAQHASRDPLNELYGPLHRTRILRQGDNSLSFYEPTG